MGPLKLIAPLVLAGAVAHAPAHSLLQSRELWATVDVCNPKDQPNTIGIRGSMPGDGRPKDVMYMRFRVQYFDLAAKRWVNLSQGGDSGLQKVGSADVARQAGRSFQFARGASKLAFRLRGTVVFQWRRGTTIVSTASRPTTAGHTSLAGADPRGFSAGTCKLT
jgi:hypothetical protein